MRSFLLGVALVGAVLFGARPTLHAFEMVRSGSPCADALPVPAALRLPAVVPPGEPVAIEHRMLDYLASYDYRDLGWCVDKSVRDTGPFVDGASYGTHPAVRIYYSPEMIDWLRHGRKGVPRDGAVMIKEQYGDKPAEYFKGRTPADLKPTDWTVMIRRSSASRDGWFWAEVYVGMFAVKQRATAYPNAGFGLYCIRCHASAAKAMTFASLENVKGFPGEPLQYYVDDSWRQMVSLAQRHVPKTAIVSAVAQRMAPARAPLAVQTFPPEPLDTYVAHAHVPHMFVTSDQCIGCHSAASGKPFGPTMWVTPAPDHAALPGLNVSEYGEWRWSPMALAGRDPVFFAQFESEMNYLATIRDKHVGHALHRQVTAICMTCHAAMGSRALAHDHPGHAFTPQMVFDAVPTHPSFHYGGLARDGISCTICHHIVEPKTPPGVAPLAYFLNHKINGQFDLGAADKLYGPFKDGEIVTHPMNEALGAKPHYSKYVSSSRMCGSCHAISLPVVDHPPISATPVEHDVEQATYLEWINSRYQDEYHPLPGAKSCQACHMPEGITDPLRGIAIAHIASKIALVEDTSYPQTTNAAPQSELDVRYRSSGFHRHELLGLNAFLLTLFKQYPNVMGVRTGDYMSGSTTDLDDAIAHVIQQARTQTATVTIRKHIDGDTLTADVDVVNLTGHRFPSGVGFRRAWLDVDVRDARAPAGAPPLFRSGSTNAHGSIVGADGKPLPTETFARGSNGKQQFQPHFDETHPITNENQAEIFEEIVEDHDGTITNSFIRRDRTIKDNRLLPQGWTPNGPVPMPKYFLEATYPKGRAAHDPRYRDGKGHAIVRYVVRLPHGVNPADVRVTATLYYQSWSPFFIAQRRTGDGLAATRFRALVDGVDLRGTALQGWKIRIASAHG